MDVKHFWNLIDESLVETDSALSQLKWFETKFRSLSDGDLIDFEKITAEMLNKAYSFRLAYAFGFFEPEYTVEENRFEYYRAWLIMQGQMNFEKVLADPDALADFKDVTDCEEFLYLPTNEYNRRHGEFSMPMLPTFNKPVMTDEPQTKKAAEEFESNAPELFSKLFARRNAQENE